MNIHELKENNPLKVIEVIKHRKVPTIFNNPPQVPIIEDKLIETEVITDGEVISQSEETIKPIEDFFFGKEKYSLRVDTLKEKYLLFKNYSYIITYTIAQENLLMGTFRGRVPIIKDINIYLANINNRKAYKSAKQAIKKIKRFNCSAHFNSIASTLVPRGEEIFEELSPNVHRLIRKNKC